MKKTFLLTLMLPLIAVFSCFAKVDTLKCTIATNLNDKVATFSTDNFQVLHSVNKNYNFFKDSPWLVNPGDLIVFSIYSSANVANISKIELIHDVEKAQNRYGLISIVESSISGKIKQAKRDSPITTIDITSQNIVEITLNNAGNDSRLSEIRIYYGAPVTDKPKTLAHTKISPESFNINWEDNPDASGYEIKVLKSGMDPNFEYINEDFRKCDGKGGQVGEWDKRPEQNIVDLEDWKIEYMKDNVYINEPLYNGNQCIRVGRSTYKSKATTPKLGFTGDGNLTFKIASYNNVKVNVSIEIEGDGSVSQPSYTTPSNTATATGYQEYTTQIKGVTPESRILFTSGGDGSSSIFHLKDVKVVAPKNGYAVLNNAPYRAEKGDTSLSVTGLEPYNTYKYIIKAFGTGDITGESRHHSEYTDTMEVKTNLTSLFKEGVDGESHNLNIPLYGVWADETKDILYVKTQPNYCTYFSHPGDDNRDSYEDKVEDFDQRDWIGLKIAQPWGYVNKMIEAGISGVYDGAELNPTLKDVELTPVYAYNDDDKLNQYAPCNFTQPMAQNNYKPFWVKPQINEIATVVGLIKNINDVYYLCDQNDEMVEIDNSFNYIKEESALKYYKFKALIGRKASSLSRSILEDNEEYIIKAISEVKIATDVESTVSDGEAVITIVGNVVRFNTQEEGVARIYNLSGNIVNEEIVANGSVINLESGLYIIDFASKRVKALIK